MCVFTACDELKLAAYTLATGTESIHERLAIVWNLHLKQLDLDDAPEFLQHGFEGVRTSLKQIVSDDLDSSLEIPDAGAIDLVQRVLFLADDLTQIATVAHYKQIATEFYSIPKQKPGSEKMNERDPVQHPRRHDLDSRQRLQLAVCAIASGIEPIQLRFARAWDEHLANVETIEFPEYMRKCFADLRDDARDLLGVSEPAPRLSEERARQLASRLFFLSQRANELSIVKHYRRSLGVF
jgi:hypothetical protein